MDDALLWHRLQFGFTITYHYLFPQLTMGLAWILVYWKWRHLRTGDERYGNAVRFWARIFGINFTLGMEGMFAFFLESAMVGAMVWGEKRLGPRNHFLATLGVAAGSWLSGYFILVTNAFMQHPVGYSLATDGTLRLADLQAYLLNPWALVVFLHNQTAAVVTGSFVVAAVGALYALRNRHSAQAALFLKTGCIIGLLSSVIVAFPTGDMHAKKVAQYQPVALAAMEGRFHSGPMAEVNMIGQPNVKERRLDNPIRIPGALSFLAYGSFYANVRGLDEFPEDTWPTNIELLYYAFHIMVGLGTIFIVLMACACIQLARGRLEKTPALLWALMLAFPFPFIATSAGWMVAELGRQPWLVYGLLRTTQGTSEVVSGGDVLFTLIGFVGLYFVLGVLYLFMVGREILHGPQPTSSTGKRGAAHG